MDQHDLLITIRETHTEISWLQPFRDLGLIPNPAASETAISRAEARLGRALPPSYRAFLTLHDGWPRFFEGASLLGTANLGHRQYEDLARAAFEAAETPIPDLGPPTRPRARSLIPFGADLEGTTLFAFNPAVVDADGEYEVIAWVNELGVRQPSFGAFLEWILDMGQQDLAGLTAAPLAKTA
ncbi:MAG TPA: SMI1/KNR4 family protein [Polyangiaceae bacterium]|nr:SMI1/KNR4 family protein [Polyangiaceae bacterium]